MSHAAAIMGSGHLVRKVEATITDHRLLRPGEHVLVAVSGGPDSVALLGTLDALRHAWRLQLTVWHLNHGIRDGEATRDQQLVEDLGSRLGHPVIIDRAAIAAGGNLEARARDHRHEGLRRVARRLGCGRIALGHTQTDQAETVLLWLLRGAGTRGLGAMAPRAGALIRPLLECSRSEVLQFLEDRGLPWAEDTSNRDERFTRNRIRHRLVPELLAIAGPPVIATIARSAALLREDERLLDTLTRRKLGRARPGVPLSASSVRSLAPALRTRALRRWIAISRGSLRGIAWKHVALLEAHLESRESGSIDLPGGVVRYERGQLRWDAAAPRRREPFYQAVGVPGCVGRPDLGWELELSGPIPWAGERGLPVDRWSAAFDSHTLPRDLAVRSPRQGDRIRLIGLGGHQKLQDLFVNAKVPRSERASWPLLVAGSDLLWVPGLARSATARVEEGTASIVRAACRLLE